MNPRLILILSRSVCCCSRSAAGSSRRCAGRRSRLLRDPVRAVVGLSSARTARAAPKGRSAMSPGVPHAFGRVVPLITTTGVDAARAAMIVVARRKRFPLRSCVGLPNRGLRPRAARSWPASGAAGECAASSRDRFAQQPARARTSRPLPRATVPSRRKGRSPRSRGGPNRSVERIAWFEHEGLDLRVDAGRSRASLTHEGAARDCDAPSAGAPRPRRRRRTGTSTRARAPGRSLAGTGPATMAA